jgi:hypothetical protein
VTERSCSHLLLKSQTTPHKEHTLSGFKHSLKPQLVTQIKDILSQAYRNHGNPGTTSPVTMATCLISSYLTRPNFNPTIISLAVHIHTKLKTETWYST